MSNQLLARQFQKLNADSIIFHQELGLISSSYCNSVNIMNIEIDDEVDMNVYEDDDDDNEDELLPPVSGTALIAS